MSVSSSHGGVHKLPLLRKGVRTAMSPRVTVLAVVVLLLQGVGLGLCLTQVDLTATDAVQTFSSTGYPTAYTNNQYETWTISSQDLSSRVRVDVTAANIERATGSSRCDFDHITFYDGNSTSDTQLGIACDSGAAYVSSGPRMLVVFSTDGTITAAGFQASYYRTNSSLTSSSGLSGGAIAGIVIACIVVVAAIVVVVIVLCCLFFPKCRSLREKWLKRGSHSKSKVQPVRDGIEVHAMPVPSKKKQLPPLRPASGQEGQAMQQSSKLPPIGGLATSSPYNPPPFFTQGSGSWRNGPRKSLSSQGSSSGKGGGGGGGGVPPPFNYTPGGH